MRRSQRWCFCTEIICTTIPLCLLQRSLIAFYPFLVRIKNSVEGLARYDPSGSGGVADVPMDHSQGDPSLDKEPKQEASSQEVAKSTKSILHPSRLPRRNLKYTDVQHTIFNPQGHPIGSLQLTNMVKFGRNAASGGTKCKEPNTPDLGSGGASAPIQK